VTVVAMGSLGVSLGAVAQALKATAVTTNDKSQDAGTRRPVNSSINSHPRGRAAGTVFEYDGTSSAAGI
jgi:hypothetical protein